MLAVSFKRLGGANEVVGIATPTPPDAWTIDDARAFVSAVWQLLAAPAGQALRLQGTPGQHCLQFITATGDSAYVGPMLISSEALTWLEEAVFDLTPEIRH